jgi:hypothetical protein
VPIFFAWRKWCRRSSACRLADYQSAGCVLGRETSFDCTETQRFRVPVTRGVRSEPRVRAEVNVMMGKPARPQPEANTAPPWTNDSPCHASPADAARRPVSTRGKRPADSFQQPRLMLPSQIVLPPNPA